MEENMSEMKTYVMRGIARYPKLSKPFSFDNATNSFVEDYDKGDYSTLLEIPTSDIDEHIKLLSSIQDELYNELVQSKKYDPKIEIIISDLPIKEGRDQDNKPNRNTLFKFKRACTNKKGEKAKIFIVDKYKNEMSEDQVLSLGGGSDMKIKYTPYAWDKLVKDIKTRSQYVQFGITLCMLAVQVIKPVNYGGSLDCFDIEEEIGNEQIPF